MDGTALQSLYSDTSLPSGMCGVCVSGVFGVHMTCVSCVVQYCDGEVCVVVICMVWYVWW